MIPLSFSGMKDAQCPYRFKVLKIDKSYKEPETDILKIGSAVADILARYRRHCYAEGMTSDLAYLDEQKEIGVEIGIIDKVRELASNFASSEFASVPLNAEWVHVESQPVKGEKIGGFAFNQHLAFLGSHKGAWLHGDVAFRLKSDFSYYLDGALHIIDDKTGWGDGDEQQLAIYAHLVKMAFLKLPINAVKPLDQIVCTFNNIAKRTTTTLEFSPEDTNPMRELICNAIRDINARTDWPAIACDRCGFCSVPGCPIREEASQSLTSAKGSPVISIPAAITTREEAEKALLFVEFAEGISKQVKELLKGYVAKNGPVATAGKVAQFSEKESVKAKDLAQLCAALVQFGAPKELVWKELSLTKAALEKIVKKAKLEAKQAWIDAYLEKSTSKAFGIQNDKTY